MASLSVRAFEQAQRRKKYPSRTGILGIACLQRDLMSSASTILAAGESLWPKERLWKDIIEGQTAHTSESSSKFNNQIIEAAAILYQLSGAIGLDLTSAVQHFIEKQEMSVT